MDGRQDRRSTAGPADLCHVLIAVVSQALVSPEAC